jgi:hypothetical protein
MVVQCNATRQIAACYCSVTVHITPAQAHSEGQPATSKHTALCALLPDLTTDSNARKRRNRCREGADVVRRISTPETYYTTNLVGVKLTTRGNLTSSAAAAPRGAPPLHCDGEAARVGLALSGSRQLCTYQVRRSGRPAQSRPHRSGRGRWRRAGRPARPAAAGPGWWCGGGGPAPPGCHGH